MKEKDINIRIGDYNFYSRAVAIIINDNKILFQKRRTDEFWALPGGKVSVGETTKETLKRELEEELGLTKFEIDEVCTVSEYFFKFGEDQYHQYIFGHKVYVDSNEWIMKEDRFDGIEDNADLIFEWFNIDELENKPIKPDFLIEQLSKINEKEVQFISSRE